MTNVELWIDDNLMDTFSPIGIRMNRLILSPSELQTKDAQVSYSIDLPDTSTNNAALGYINIEETKDKFNRLYRAYVVVNGIRIFNGKYRLTGYSKNKYKGNLFIPVNKTVSDIFSGLKFADAGSWQIPFTAFVPSVNSYNEPAVDTPQPCVFPYVLYGVLPKVAANPDTGEYADREVWDDTVQITGSDFPPALNPLKLLQRMFANRGYSLTGSAFADDRLTKLYVSYKNDPSYPMPWNYGGSQLRITGKWSTYQDYGRGATPVTQFDRTAFENLLDDKCYYAFNLFDSQNAQVTVNSNPFGMVKSRTYIGEDGRQRRSKQVQIQTSGLYKVQLYGEISLLQGSAMSTDNVTKIRHYGAGASQTDNGFSRIRYQLALLRDRGKGDFGMESRAVDGVYYRNNWPQNSTFDYDNSPKYIPSTYAVTEEFYGTVGRRVIFVDKAQNDKIIGGMCWGETAEEPYRGPNIGFPPANTWGVVCAKPSLSWDGSYNSSDGPDKIAINSPLGYGKYEVQNDAGAMGFTQTDRFAMTVENSPAVFARSGVYEGAPGSPYFTGEGQFSAVVWLERGELLTLVATSDQATTQRGGGIIIRQYKGVVDHEIQFDLQVRPYFVDDSWLKVNSKGTGTETMDWAQLGNFPSNYIDLLRFTPQDESLDTWIDNFCKAFNLTLRQTGDTTFALDTKQTIAVSSNQSINLDGTAAVSDRTNEPTGIPSQYKIGFTINTDEEGYVETGDDGGGTFDTGAVDEKILEQKSTFSYNWYKTIHKQEASGVVDLDFPLISKSDVWNEFLPYEEAMKSKYTNLAQRFFYVDGLMNNKGATFNVWGSALSAVQMSEVLPGRCILTYRNAKNTLLSNYFTVIVKASSHYTTVEGYLTPEQYNALDGSRSVTFNGDQYFIAQLSAYDPEGRNKTTIKLIRKI